MTDIDERLRSADLVPVRDLWADIGVREPGRLPEDAPGRRVAAIVVALLTAGVALFVAYRAFQGAPRLRPAGMVPATAIAFTGAAGAEAHIVLAGADTGRQVILAPPGGGSDLFPAWSPDGSRIAFEVRTETSRQTWVMNADGTGARPVDPHFDFALPSWSPDSGHLAAVCETCSIGQIYIVNADGSGRHQLTRGPAGATLPSWSPDGSRVAFAARVAGGPPGPLGGPPGAPVSISIVGADGGKPVRLRSTGGPNVETLGWSPDGDRLAFTRVTGHSNFADLYVVNADGTGLRHITFQDGPAATDGVAWSPDGSSIAFVRSVGGRPQIFVANTDGAGVTRLTLTMRNTSPAWSPDGSRIAFFRGPSENVARLFVMNADGTSVRQVSDRLAAIGVPSWRPVP